MGSSRNKQFTSFKLLTVLSNVMKSCKSHLVLPHPPPACDPSLHPASPRYSRGVLPFGVSGPHWKKKSCLGPHIKYIATCNHTKILCFKQIYSFVLSHIHSSPGTHAARGLQVGLPWRCSPPGSHSVAVSVIESITSELVLKPPLFYLIMSQSARGMLAFGRCQREAVKCFLEVKG